MRAVLFDFDGTLAHTAPDLAAALHGLQESRGEKPAEYEDARLRASGGTKALLALAGIFPEDEEYESARADFLHRYETGGYKRTFLFGGIKNALAEIAAEGWKWGVATNKPRRYFSAVAEKMGIDSNPEAELPPDSLPLASALVAGDDCARAKPSPQPLLLAAEIAGVAPKNAVYVGDDVRDAQAAQAAGMKFILAGWGYWAAAEWRRAPAAEAVAAAPKCIPPLARMIFRAGG
ncbi:MAG: HAD family hydrolase [Gammaproteobacteria bacterium]